MGKKKARTGGGRVEKLRRRAGRAGKARAQDTGRRLVSWPAPGVSGWPACLGDEFDDVGEIGFCGVCEDCADFVDYLEAEFEFDPGCDCRVCAEAMDTGRCPVAGTCAGCGETGGLCAVTAAFRAPTGAIVACATLCRVCAAGGSFVRCLGLAGFDRALLRHSEHRAWPGSTGPRWCARAFSRLTGIGDIGMF